MGPKTLKLCDRLREATELLERNGDERWAAWLQMALTRITNGDFSGVEYLLSCYGGMGSFNDFDIQPAGGSDFNSPGCTSANERLAQLRTEMHELAQEIKREAVIEYFPLAFSAEGEEEEAHNAANCGMSFTNGASSPLQPLTPALSPEYRTEGAGRNR